MLARASLPREYFKRQAVCNRTAIRRRYRGVGPELWTLARRSRPQTAARATTERQALAQRGADGGLASVAHGGGRGGAGRLAEPVEASATHRMARQGLRADHSPVRYDRPSRAL